MYNSWTGPVPPILPAPHPASSTALCAAKKRFDARKRAAEDVFSSENSCNPWDTLNFQPLLTRCGLNISWLVFLPCCLPTHLLSISFCCWGSELPLFELHITEACRTLRQALLLCTSMRCEIIRILVHFYLNYLRFWFPGFGIGSAWLGHP